MPLISTRSLWEQSAAPITGTLSVQEAGSDTFSASGTVNVSGTLSVQEAGSDTFSASGAVNITGTLVVQEVGSDTAHISGTVFTPSIVTSVYRSRRNTSKATPHTAPLPDITGQMLVQEGGQDDLFVTLFSTIHGSMHAQETGSDKVLVKGRVLPPVTVTMRVQEERRDKFRCKGRLSWEDDDERVIQEYLRLRAA